MTGRLIAFEGGEGSGKSTQAALLAARLDAVLTYEPGATPLGARLREVLLDDAAARIDPRTEALLMAADRAQHVVEVVRPALDAGNDVVSDRFSGSTLAYQGHGRGLDIGELAWLSRWASAGLEPDLVVLLDVEQGLAAGRRCRPRDRLEAAGDTFHQRVMAGYLELARSDPGRWVVVEGAGSPDEVSERVWSVVEAWTTERATR